MYVCIDVLMYVLMYDYMYCLFVCMYVCMWVCTCMHGCVCMYVCVCVLVSLFVCMHAFIYLLMYLLIYLVFIYLSTHSFLMVTLVFEIFFGENPSPLTDRNRSHTTTHTAGRSSNHQTTSVPNFNRTHCTSLPSRRQSNIFESHQQTFALHIRER